MLSGEQHALRRLGRRARKKGFTLIGLASRYPFHCSRVAAAVAPFHRRIRELPFARDAELQIYLGTERRWHSPECDIAESIALQLVRRLDFSFVARTLLDSGFREFVDCASVKVISGIVRKNLRPEETVEVSSAAEPEGQKGRVVKAPKILVRPDPGPDAPKSSDDSATVDLPEEVDVPIAIVGWGCVVPGAEDVDRYWQSMLEGVDALVDLSEWYPVEAGDFLDPRRDPREVEPDKTYSVLAGAIHTIPYDSETLANYFTQDEFDSLTRSQQFLALALGQCVGSLLASREGVRVECALGSTADGIGEYDEALFVQSAVHVLQGLDEPPPLKAAFERILEEAMGHSVATPTALARSRPSGKW